MKSPEKQVTVWIKKYDGSTHEGNYYYTVKDLETGKFLWISPYPGFETAGDAWKHATSYMNVRWEG